MVLIVLPPLNLDWTKNPTSSSYLAYISAYPDHIYLTTQCYSCPVLGLLNLSSSEPSCAPSNCPDKEEWINDKVG